MKLIGAHDAATGEKGYGWRKILTLFAQTQSKTIDELIAAGAIYLDLRVRKTNRGWVFAHGPWESQTTVEPIFEKINELNKQEMKINVSITHEGSFCDEFEPFVKEIEKKYPYLWVSSYAVKFDENRHWKTLGAKGFIQKCGYEKYFCDLSTNYGKYYFLIPIPRFWKLFKFKNIEFLEDTEIRAVDFL